MINLLLLISLIIPCCIFADNAVPTLQASDHFLGYLCLAIFIFAYIVVIFEEQIKLKKTIPVMCAAGIIWGLVSIIGIQKGLSHEVSNIIKSNINEFAEISLFLLVAMTYINIMKERNIFNYVRSILLSMGLSYRKLFWLITLLSFFISPIADNLTTALFMASIVISLGNANKSFTSISLVGIVISVNAGGAFSPFGDITTLMVWQKGMLKFSEFFNIFIPSVVNYFIPTFIMQFYISKESPTEHIEDISSLKPGAKTSIVLFLLTVLTAIIFNHFLNLPPMIGMMLGLCYLFIYTYLVQIRIIGNSNKKYNNFSPDAVFEHIKNSEWDTLLFFYGIILCVGGLSSLGYFQLAGNHLYEISWSPNISKHMQMTLANSIIGILSAIIDNIPIMFSVLTMNPTMPSGQWLLVVLTAGVGGSLLSIGSAAGLALMGIGRKYYTFMSHLRWVAVIFLGYILSIFTHIIINDSLF